MKENDTKEIIPLRSARQGTLLTVIVPVYNEAKGISSFHDRLTAVLKKTPVQHKEVIYINDGSMDNSMLILKRIAMENHGVQLINFSRNFGKEAAMTAGINQSKGDAVIIIDADLQDPPELIPEMVRQWQQGYDIVNMRRRSRAGETFLKKKTAQGFYSLMALLGPVRMPENVGDFRLLSRKAVNALKQVPERNRFMKGLFAWIGFSAKEILYNRDPRFAGETKWNFKGLFNLAIEGITSYTVAPLRISTYLGLLVSMFAFGYGAFNLLKTVIIGNPVQGFPTLIITILFIGGFQLLAIGIAGEYIARIFLETKGRPLYIVKDQYADTAGSFSSLNKISKKENVR